LQGLEAFEAYAELLFEVVVDAVNHAFAAGDAELAPPHVVDPFLLRGFGPAVRYDLELANLAFGACEVLWERFEIGENLRAHDGLDAAVLSNDIEHERGGAFAPQAILA